MRDTNMGGTQRYIAAAFVLLMFAFCAMAASNRVVVNINPGWKFTKGDSTGAQASGYSDAAWSSVGLPHSASTPYFMEQSMYLGWAWYRKHLTLNSQWSGRRVFLEFEAVFQHCWVYVNGTLVGEHKGGYTGFSYDITSNVNFTGDNVIAVRLNNLWDARIAPRAGDHNWHCGIYRDVRLVVTDPLHVTRFGTFITTPNASATRSGVSIKTELKNDAATSKTLVLKSVIVDSMNQIVASVSSSATLAAGKMDTIAQDTAINSPKLWSPSSPYLYTVRSEVYDGSTLVDVFTSPFGVRWFTASTTDGFFLNGQHLYLRGFNVHQDRAGWADAVPNSGFFRDMKMLKDCGTNCIRASHYPKDPAYYEACDKFGILVFAELQFWGRGGFAGGKDGDWWAEAYPIVDGDRPEFEANLTSNLRDMIREARNHPSIFAYSLGNETDMQMTGTVLNNCKTFWKQLNSAAHHEDTTRLTSCGWVGFIINDNDPAVVKQYIDLGGFNNGQPTIQYPFPALTTEYGSCVVENRPGSFTGCGEPAADKYRCGALRWCGFHHGTHCEGNGGAWGHMGVIDYNRLPLRQYYWYKSQWLGAAQPTWPSSGTASKLDITADKTTILNDGTDDCQLTISVLNSAGTRISNSVNATITVTGPGLLPTGTTWSFSTPDGQQAIDMRSYGTGAITVTATSSGLQNGTVTVTATEPAVGVEQFGTIQSSRSVMSGNLELNPHTIVGLNKSVRISYAVAKPGRCNIVISDLCGKTVHTLDNSFKKAGQYMLSWNGSNDNGRLVGSGEYIVSLQAEGLKKTGLLYVVR